MPRGSKEETQRGGEEDCTAGDVGPSSPEGGPGHVGEEPRARVDHGVENPRQENQVAEDCYIDAYCVGVKLREIDIDRYADDGKGKGGSGIGDPLRGRDPFVRPPLRCRHLFAINQSLHYPL